MKEVLEGLWRTENVLAVFLYDGDRLIESFLPGNISLDVEAMCSSLGKASLASDSAGISVDKATFHFDRYLLFHNRLSKNSSLNLICSRKVSRPLLDISLNKVFQKLKETLPSNKKIEVTSQVIDDVMCGALAFPIERLQDIFYEYIGPVAAIVMRECVEKWIVEGAPSLSSLSELVEIMREEVEAADQEAFGSRAKRLVEKIM